MGTHILSAGVDGLLPSSERGPQAINRGIPEFVPVGVRVLAPSIVATNYTLYNRMPTPARWLIKTALVYLVLALAVALVRAGQTMGIVPGTPSTLWLPQLHLLTVGWLTQLIFGVAYWLFPSPKPRVQPSPRLIWGAYGALNGGLILRLGCEPAFLPGGVQGWGLAASALLQWGASLLFVTHFWRRVRPK